MHRLGWTPSIVPREGDQAFYLVMDVSADVAQELRQRCDPQLRDVPFFLQPFADRHEGRYHHVQLRLPIRPA